MLREFERVSYQIVLNFLFFAVPKNVETWKTHFLTEVHVFLTTRYSLSIAVISVYLCVLKELPILYYIVLTITHVNYVSAWSLTLRGAPANVVLVVFVAEVGMAAMVVTAVAVMAEDMEGDTVATMIGNVNLLLSVVFAFALGYECVCLCAPTGVSLTLHIRSLPYSLYMLPLVAAWSLCGGIAICCLVARLWTTPCFYNFLFDYVVVTHRAIRLHSTAITVCACQICRHESVGRYVWMICRSEWWRQQIIWCWNVSECACGVSKYCKSSTLGWHTYRSKFEKLWVIALEWVTENRKLFFTLTTCYHTSSGSFVHSSENICSFAQFFVGANYHLSVWNVLLVITLMTSV